MNSTKTVPQKRDSRLFGVLQRVGRSFMLPIALLPIAGLLLGIGASLTNTAMIESYGLAGILGEGTILNSILTVLSAVGSIIAVGCISAMSAFYASPLVPARKK